MDENLAMMWLTRSLGLNLKKVKHLLSVCQRAEQVYAMSAGQLRHLAGVDETMVSALEKGKQILPAWQKEMEQAKVRYLSVYDPAFPQWLREVYQPPVGLYVRGTFPCQQEQAISMIGARRCSRYGKDVAHQTAQALAKDGFWIVSGMAEGIDSICHEGALDAGGNTIAVLGFGHNRCYPASKRALMERIAGQGAVISEYPPNHPAGKYTFPQRNRIIAGLSSGLIVVEAGKHSGTMITVDFALDAGRTVMAFPSNVTSRFGEGTNHLIQQGCPIITCMEDIYIELGHAPHLQTSKQEKPEKQDEQTDLSPQEMQVLQALGEEEIAVELLREKTDLPMAQLKSVLTMLEIYGQVERLPQERYRKIRMMR